MASVHLLVLIHGLWGSPSHLNSMAETIKDFATTRKPLIETDDSIELEVLLATTNSEDLTYDGIDSGGERVAEEVYKKVEEIEDGGRKVTRFSISGYSLGGLIGRYLVGILLQRKFFDTVQPMNFTTFATPHIGVPRYPNFVSALSHTIGPRLLSRTGEQLFACDKWNADTGRPLLLVMADPDRIFYQALSLFSNVTIYANAVHDLSSPYTTSAIDTEDPFLNYHTSGIELTFLEDYPNILKSYTISDHPVVLPPKPVVLSKDWFKSVTPNLPPALQYRFPFNIILFMALPILIPTFMGMVLVRFSLASRSSRKRIKSLEEDVSYTQKLIHVVAQLEKDLEDAAVDLVEDDEPSKASHSGVVAPTDAGKQEQPTLKPIQKSMVKMLNGLPQLKKQRAFFRDVRNSHAMIICRDPRFEIHELGRGILKHWVDHFTF